MNKYFKRKYNEYRWTTAPLVRKLDTKFSIGNRENPVWRSILDEAIQDMVSITLWVCVLCLAHHPPITKHHGHRRREDWLRQKCYWSHMSYDFYATIAEYTCAKYGNQYNRTRALQQFPSSEKLQFAATDIVGSNPRTTQEVPHVVVINNRICRITQTISTAMTSATKKESKPFWSLDHPVRYNEQRTDQWQPAICKQCFVTICGYLCSEHLTTTTYHLQTNELVERLNMTLERPTDKLHYWSRTR